MGNYLKRYINNKCSRKDFDAAIEMMISPKKEDILEKQMKEHWDNTTNKGNLPDLSNMLYRIHYHINKNEKTDSKKLRLIRYFSRVAAILILPVTIALGYMIIHNFSVENLVQTISSPLASRTSFDLPDGSKVWLNSGSTLSFPTHFTGRERIVKLNGQAYFDVKKDKIPFHVKTENFTVNVLGTAFDISAYQGEKASVTLVRGKVAIETPKGCETVLKPREQAFVKKGSIQKRNVNPDLYISWKDNLLVFVDEPLEEVVSKLERWYNLDISIEDESIKKINVTGTFEYESISEILQLIEITNSIKYSYDKDKRTIILKHK